MEDKKVLLSVKDLEVKFRVRGRILTAIRGISLDIYENESIAIVGESGSGKSVFTKTFAGMLEDNGFIDKGEIIYSDPELSETNVKKGKTTSKFLEIITKKLNELSCYEESSEIYKEILKLESEKEMKGSLSIEENDKYQEERRNLLFERTEAYNLKQTLDSSKEKEQIKDLSAKISEYDAKITALDKEYKIKKKERLASLKNDHAYLSEYNKKKAELNAKYHEKNGKFVLTDEIVKRNEIFAKEIYLSIGRYSFFKRISYTAKLLKEFENSMRVGADLKDDAIVDSLFDKVVFRVRYIDENDSIIHGNCKINLAKIKYTKDWQQIRGCRIATVFQDPMTSLNPVITIGNQISSIIMKHQNVSEIEAKKKAIEMMQKVGIPEAEKRYDDYPFQYSGGMRQRIVIAIALSCQPKILICDEPTTALDVTIQAQILRLIKNLQKEFGYTIVFITHDLGVVANVADRVAVLYAGQIVELGNVEEVFYDPRHPYTWALLSSMPQLAERNTTLYSISGTPPSLYNKIVGDPFAPRNPYCLKIDTLMDPPMFKVTETHYAKTWLLDPRSPKVEKPEAIKDIHEKLLKAFNI